MPGDETSLNRPLTMHERIRRDLAAQSSDAKFDGRPLAAVRRGGRKIIIRREDNLESSIKVDYNPTELPFSKVINWSDKTVIGGNDAIEFTSIGRKEFTWALFLTDFGYHGVKNPDETVRYKLNWLNGVTEASRQFVDGEPVDQPYNLFLEKGNDIIRVIILKIAGKETMLNFKFDPVRAFVNVTFRRVFRARTGEDAEGIMMESTLRNVF